MKTEHILLALQIGRKGSISKAAKAMFISQPTASNILKALESELGYPLFLRSRGGIVPTEEGTAFLRHAAAIEESLQAIEKIQRPVRRASLRIISADFEFTETAFERMCNNKLCGWGGIDLKFQIIPDIDEALHILETGGVDVAVILCRMNLYESILQNIKKKYLEAELIGRTHLEIICGRDHPMLADGKLQDPPFDRYPCFISAKAENPELYMPEYLAKHEHRMPRHISLTYGETRYRLLSENNGYLISTPISAIDREKYRLASLPLEDSDMAVFAVLHADPQNEELIREYIQLCKTCFQEFYAAASASREETFPGIPPTLG